MTFWGTFFCVFAGGMLTMLALETVVDWFCLLYEKYRQKKHKQTVYQKQALALPSPAILQSFVPSEWSKAFGQAAVTAICWESADTTPWFAGALLAGYARKIELGAKHGLNKKDVETLKKIKQTLGKKHAR